MVTWPPSGMLNPPETRRSPSLHFAVAFPGRTELVAVLVFRPQARLGTASATAARIAPAPILPPSPIPIIAPNPTDCLVWHWPPRLSPGTLPPDAGRARGNRRPHPLARTALGGARSGAVDDPARADQPGGPAGRTGRLLHGLDPVAGPLRGRGGGDDRDLDQLRADGALRRRHLHVATGSPQRPGGDPAERGSPP